MSRNYVNSKTDNIHYYRNNFRLAIKLAMLLIVLNFGLVGFMFYQVLTKPKPDYFVTTSDGQLINIYPNSLNK